jgi:pyruvate-formate lyase-activating enzyme
MEGTMNERKVRRPQTRRGGAITFRGVEYATEAELEQALAEALGEFGWRLTPRGEGYLAGYAEAQRKGAA